jgi:hypothetical protein
MDRLLAARAQGSGHHSAISNDDLNHPVAKSLTDRCEKLWTHGHSAQYCSDVHDGACCSGCVCRNQQVPSWPASAVVPVHNICMEQRC